MPDFRDYIKQRETFSGRSQSTLANLAKGLQGALYASLLDVVVSNLETGEDGRIKFSTKNVGIVAGSTAVWLAYRKNSGTLGKWIAEKLRRLFNLNTSYMGEMGKVSETVEKKAARLLFRNLGFDIDKEKIIENSWLDNLLAQDAVKQKVMARLNAAVQSRMPLADFRKQFKNDFQDNKKGLGLVSRYYEQNTFDMFQQFDRSVQEVYRQELGLEYAIYSGTIKQPTKQSSGTRNFCWQRVGNLYNIETIDSWNNLDWAGKIDGSDVKLTAGGYQCRHHLSWLSKETADLLIKRGKELNKLNPPKPKVK